MNENVTIDWNTGDPKEDMTSNCSECIYYSVRVEERDGHFKAVQWCEVRQREVAGLVYKCPSIALERPKPKRTHRVHVYTEEDDEAIASCRTRAELDAVTERLGLSFNAIAARWYKVTDGKPLPPKRLKLG